MSAKVLNSIYLLSCKSNFKQGWRKLSSLSYMHHVGKDPLYSSTVGRVLEKSAAKYEDRDAIISRHQGITLTFDEAFLQVDKLAAGLKATGLNVGDRVGIWAPNLVEWYIAMLACARAGFIMVAINPAYQESEIEYAINKVNCKGLICTNQFKKQNYYEILNKLIPNLEQSQPGKLKSSRIPSLQNIIIISNKEHKGTYQYDQVLNMADEKAIKQLKKDHSLIQSDSGFNIQYTSGTTGKPKAALLSHFNVVNNAYEIAKRNELNLKHHKICCQVPFFHAFGLCITTIAALQFGSTIVLPGASYNPNESLDAIKEEKCTVIHGTPTMYVDLIKVQRQRLEDVYPEIAVSGGAPCSPQLFNQMMDVLGVKKVKSVYGLTETTSVVFQSLVNEDITKATTTVGHVGDHVEVKVVDENGRIVPRGTPGELYVRAYTSFLEYYGDELKTKEIIGNDRWLKTGDKFILGEDGYGKVVGRLNDMIIRGGENIYPKEIEEFLDTHPYIIESQVLGTEDERLGEIVCACIRLKEGKSLTLKELQEFCKEKIAHFKIPAALHVLNEFPKTTSGKVQKYILKEQIKNK